MPPLPETLEVPAMPPLVDAPEPPPAPAPDVLTAAAPALPALPPEEAEEGPPGSVPQPRPSVARVIVVPSADLKCRFTMHARGRQHAGAITRTS